VGQDRGQAGVEVRFERFDAALAAAGFRAMSGILGKT
jgi:hypothetical protein